MHGTAATLPVDALAEPARGAALDSHPLQASTPEAMTAYCYEQCSHAVFRYLACRLRNASDAEDLTQETFIRFHRALGQGERFQGAARDRRGRGHPSLGRRVDTRPSDADAAPAGAGLRRTRGSASSATRTAW